MEDRKYFYLIKRSGGIREIPYTEERFNKAFQAFTQKGIFVPKGFGSGINMVDVEEICNQEQYDTHIKTACPKLYIRDGTWYDSKERRIVSHEPWKQKEIDEQLKLEDPDEERPLTPEERERIREKNEEFVKMMNWKFSTEDKK